MRVRNKNYNCNEIKMKKQCIQNSLLTSILNVKLHCLLAVSFVTELSSAVLKISCFSTQSHTFPKELNLMVIEIITNKIFVSIFLIQVAVPTQHRPKMTLNFLDQVHKFPQVKNKCKIFPSVSPTPLDPTFLLGRNQFLAIFYFNDSAQ